MDKQLRSPLLLEVKVEPHDDFTDEEADWIPVCQLWGHIETLRDRQRVQNALANRIVSHKITTRWHPQIPVSNEDLRLVYRSNGERNFNVVGFVNVDELDVSVEWECIEARK